MQEKKLPEDFEKRKAEFEENEKGFDLEELAYEFKNIVEKEWNLNNEGIDGGEVGDGQVGQCVVKLLDGSMYAQEWVYSSWDSSEFEPIRSIKGLEERPIITYGIIEER